MYIITNHLKSRNRIRILITPLQADHGRRNHVKLVTEKEELRLGDSFCKRICKLEMGGNKGDF
jgi:hypothetical protein